MSVCWGYTGVFAVWQCRLYGQMDLEGVGRSGAVTINTSKSSASESLCVFPDCFPSPFPSAEARRSRVKQFPEFYLTRVQ